MTELAQGYDSLTNENCLYCGDPILIDSPRVIFGTGNSLLAVYHIACWERIMQARKEEERIARAGKEE
jgi:hypothetical protein